MAKAKGIYKRGSIYWVRYALSDGTMKFETSGSTKFKDAENLLIKRKQEVREGKLPETIHITNHSFKELAEEYKKFAARQRCYRTKVYLINQLIQDFGVLPLRKFSTMVLEQYQTTRMEKGNKPATINRFLATIKHMFTKAVDWNFVEEEVLKRIRKVKMLEEKNERLRFLSSEECETLIDACPDHLRPIVTVALNTGMRKNEILKLKWDQINHGFILLVDTKNGERREIPINENVRRVLTSTIRRLDVPFVFYDPTTLKPYGDIKHAFTSSCRRAGIVDFKFHDTRHTFASHLVMNGVDLATVRVLLGHKTLTMTLRYAHLAPAHKANAVGVLDQVFKGNTSTSSLQRIG